VCSVTRGVHSVDRCQQDAFWKWLFAINAVLLDELGLVLATDVDELMTR